MRKQDYEAVKARLTAPGQPFEMAPALVDGQPMRGWRHAPATLRAIFETSRPRGDAPFLVLGDERLSFAEHYRLVAQCAHALRQGHGIARGDRVAIAMRNLPEWSVAFWAIVSIGAVAVSINAWMAGPEMAYCLNDSGSRILIADEERIERLAGFLPGSGVEAVVAVRCAGAGLPGTIPWERFIAVEAEDLPDAAIEPEDDATILYTSGTTGRPKGALGSHRASCHNAISTRYFVAVDRALRGLPVRTVVPDGTAGCFLLSVPLFHGAGCQNGLVFSMFGGEKLVMMARWDAREGARLIAEERVTEVAAAPAHFVQLAEIAGEGAGHALSSVRAATVGGASPPGDLPQRIAALMPNAAIGTGYGQTECTQIAAFSFGDDYAEHPASCGRPIPICDIRIVDADGKDVAPGATGELLVRTVTVVKGYINRAAETRETFADGWLRTGDLMHMDAEGLLFLDDRKKDMLIRGGENIYSVEVEQALYSHPDVVEAAVFGVPHPVLGEEPVAVVHLLPAATADAAALRAHAAQRIARFKVPVAVEIAPGPLPRNANGKIMKRDLRAEYLGRHQAAGSNRDATA